MVTCTNVGTTYDNNTNSSSLPVGYLDFTGVTQLLVWVRVNKIGTGTQSWQLWNVTDSAEIAVFNDAAGAGLKDLEQTVTVALAGVKKLRMRTKSTVAADDPVFVAWDIKPVMP